MAISLAKSSFPKNPEVSLAFNLFFLCVFRSVINSHSFNSVDIYLLCWIYVNETLGGQSLSCKMADTECFLQKTTTPYTKELKWPPALPKNKSHAVSGKSGFVLFQFVNIGKQAIYDA